MSIETGIFQLLTANITVASLVATRIYPVILPEGATFPAVVYQRIDTVRDTNTLDNAADTPHARFQLSCWAEEFTQAAALEAAVRETLAGFIGTADDTKVQAIYVVDTRDTWEFEISTAGLYRRDIDFEIWYEE